MKCLNRYLYDEIEKIIDGRTSEFVSYDAGKFRMKVDTKIIMFCSRTPCK